MQALSPSTIMRQHITWMLMLALSVNITASAWAGPPTRGQQKKPNPTVAAPKTAPKVVLPPVPTSA